MYRFMWTLRPKTARGHARVSRVYNIADDDGAVSVAERRDAGNTGF